MSDFNYVEFVTVWQTSKDRQELYKRLSHIPRKRIASVAQYLRLNGVPIKSFGDERRLGCRTIDFPRLKKIAEELSESK